MTDTPNVNPLNPDQPVQRRPTQRDCVPGVSTDRLDVVVLRNSQPRDRKTRASSFMKETSTPASAPTGFRRQGPVYEAENRLVAEGSVVFDQADQQRITGSRSGTTAPRPDTSRTPPASQTKRRTARIYFADRVEKISLDTIVAINVQITACDEDVPKWSFHASKATIKPEIACASFRQND